MSPGERAACGRREPGRPQYAVTAPGYPPPYYPPYGVPPNAWLGAPLISMAGRAPPSRHTPASKLAMQAQGAPLIIQNRHDRRKFVNPPDQRVQRATTNTDHNNRDRCEVHEVGRPRNQHQSRPTRNGRNNNTDAVSVASDESSGSTNSETMLPRIIKPRKRRKKDRKPNNVAAHELSATLDLGEVDQCVASSMSSLSRNIFDESLCRDNLSLPYRLDVKVLEVSEPLSETYRVSALGEALEATRFGQTEAASPSEWAVSSCQCRYCDPVGQIWDSESISDLLDNNSNTDFLPTKLEDSMKVVGPMGRRGTDTTLRRSWSDPSSRVPDRSEINTSDAVSAPNLYSLFPPVRRTSTPEPRSPLALEISSEIVTSMNGHRDLEIKLFSSTQPAPDSDQRSFYADKNESVVNKCTITRYERKVNCIVNSDQVVLSVKADSKNSEGVSESGFLSAFVPGEPSRNICDLTLVTA